MRAERARADHTDPILHPRTRGVHLERLRSHASGPCIPVRPSRWDVPPRSTPPNPVAQRRARGARRAGSAWPHGPWRLPMVRGTPPRRCLPRRAVFEVPGVYPLQKIPTARARAAVLRPLALVVPSERPWATRRPRSGGIHAPWTVERRAGRSLAPTGSCHCAVGDAAAPGACAACAARARL